MHAPRQRVFPSLSSRRGVGPSDRGAPPGHPVGQAVRLGQCNARASSGASQFTFQQSYRRFPPRGRATCAALFGVLEPHGFDPKLRLPVGPISPRAAPRAGWSRPTATHHRATRSGRRSASDNATPGCLPGNTGKRLCQSRGRSPPPPATHALSPGPQAGATACGSTGNRRRFCPQYPRARSTRWRKGSPASPRRTFSTITSLAVSGRVSEAICGVTVTRGCAQ